MIYFHGEKEKMRQEMAKLISAAKSKERKKHASFIEGTGPKTDLPCLKVKKLEWQKRQLARPPKPALLKGGKTKPSIQLIRS